MPVPRTKLPTRQPVHISHARGIPGGPVLAGGRRPAFFGGNVRALGYQPGLDAAQSIAYQALLAAGADREYALRVALGATDRIARIISSLPSGALYQLTNLHLPVDQLLAEIGLGRGSGLLDSILTGIDTALGIQPLVTAFKTGHYSNLLAPFNAPGGGITFNPSEIARNALNYGLNEIRFGGGEAGGGIGAGDIAQAAEQAEQGVQAGLQASATPPATRTRPFRAAPPTPKPSFFQNLIRGIQTIPQAIRQGTDFADELFDALGQGGEGNPPPPPPPPPMQAQPYAPEGPLTTPLGQNVEEIPQQYPGNIGEVEHIQPPEYPSYPLEIQPSAGHEPIPLEIQPQLQRPTYPGPQGGGGGGGGRPTYPGPQGGNCPTCQTVEQLEQQTQKQLSDETALKALGSTTPQQTQQIVDELRQIEDQLNQPTSPQQKQSILNRLRTLRQSCSNVCQQVKQKISFCMECDDQDEAMKFLNGEQAACNVVPGSQSSVPGYSQPELQPDLGENTPSYFVNYPTEPTDGEIEMPKTIPAEE
jgi:hypothetical protein